MDTTQTLAEKKTDGQKPPAKKCVQLDLFLDRADKDDNDAKDKGGKRWG